METPILRGLGGVRKTRRTSFGKVPFLKFSDNFQGDSYMLTANYSSLVTDYQLLIVPGDDVNIARAARTMDNKQLYKEP